MQYRLPLSDDISVTPRIEANGRGGDYYWEVDNRDKRAPVNLVNIRLSFNYKRLSLTGFVENLFDKVYIVDVVAQRWSGSPFGDYNQRSRGRIGGVTARMAF